MKQKMRPLRKKLLQKFTEDNVLFEERLTMSVISGRYKLVILFFLLDIGPMRFGELLRQFGDISSRVLTQQLRELEQDDLIHRDVYPDSPPKVVYSLSERGRTLEPLMRMIYQWGLDNLAYYESRAALSGCKLKKNRQVHLSTAPINHTD